MAIPTRFPVTIDGVDCSAREATIDIGDTGYPCGVTIIGFSGNAAELERAQRTCKHCRFWERRLFGVSGGRCARAGAPVGLCKSTFGCRSWEPEDL